jgi:predicted phosphodiesterase
VTGSSEAVWGLVSDVHGNLPMLDTALRVLAAAGARRLAFLGDYLGRGDSDGCVRRIREVADVAVLGNRDVDWQERVAAETKAWVRSLPRMAQVHGLLLAHGDARLTPRLSTSQIRRDFLQAWQVMDERGAEVLAFGHSHWARVWRKAHRDAPAEPLAGGCARLELDAGYRYFVNVGTTGLPFPGKGGPSVARLDLAARTIDALPLGTRE